MSHLSEVDQTVTRADGGFCPDMELFTPSGPIRTAELTPGDVVFALNPETRIMKPKPVTGVEYVSPQDSLVAIEGRRVTLHVSSNQPIYYQTKAIDQPRLVAARDLTERVWYKFIPDWHSPTGRTLQTVDITDLTDNYEARFQSEKHGNTIRAMLPEGCDPVRNNSHTGYYFDSTTFKRNQTRLESLADTIEICAGPNAWGRPYRFDGSDFLEYLSWFVTEGSVCWASPKETAEIQIAQQKSQHRASIRALFDRMEIRVSEMPDAFCFSSTTYGELLQRLCGATSPERKLPWFLWHLSREQKQLVLDTLLAGDGNEHGTYYTVSKRLAYDVLRLVTELGIIPRYSHYGNCWQVYVNDTNDGFHSGKHVHRRPAPKSIVRLTVRDYPAVLAGKDGKFQWVGVSRVS